MFHVKHAQGLFHVKRFFPPHIIAHPIKSSNCEHGPGWWQPVEAWICNISNLWYTFPTMGKTVLLTGRPGVGKTTLIKDVVKKLPGQAGGFYTEEMRERGRRQGFKIVTLDGREGILAHVSIKSRMRVSKYGVKLADLEDIGVAAIREAIAQKEYVIIDEIGKMELFSQAFKDAVWEAVHSDKSVLGTVTLSSHPWADSIKALPQVTVIEVTLANRDKVARQVMDMLAHEENRLG